MSASALRLMSFLIGMHAKEGIRPDRKRLCKAIRRSPRTVTDTLAELVDLGWIEVDRGGAGHASMIRVINTVDWKTARVARVARVGGRKLRELGGENCASVDVLSLRKNLQENGTRTEASPQTPNLRKTDYFGHTPAAPTVSAPGPQIPLEDRPYYAEARKALPFGSKADYAGFVAERKAGLIDALGREIHVDRKPPVMVMAAAVGANVVSISEGSRG